MKGLATFCWFSNMKNISYIYRAFLLLRMYCGVQYNPIRISSDRIYYIVTWSAMKVNIYFNADLYFWHIMQHLKDKKGRLHYNPPNSSLVKQSWNNPFITQRAPEHSPLPSTPEIHYSEFKISDNYRNKMLPSYSTTDWTEPRSEPP